MAILIGARSLRGTEEGRGENRPCVRSYDRPTGFRRLLKGNYSQQDQQGEQEYSNPACNEDQPVLLRIRFLEIESKID